MYFAEEAQRTEMSCMNCFGEIRATNSGQNRKNVSLNLKSTTTDTIYVRYTNRIQGAIVSSFGTRFQEWATISFLFRKMHKNWAMNGEQQQPSTAAIA